MTGHSALRSLGVGLAVAAMVTASAAGALAKGPGDSNGGGGGKPAAGEDVGNNLSYPLLIAGEPGFDGPALRGAEYTPVLGTLPSDYLVLPDGRAYYQQNAFNTWQASNANVGCAGIDVDWINWGDNLESKDWAYRQMIRVETQLYDNVGATMPDGGDTLAYGMVKTNDLTGKNEMWGLHTDSAGNADPYTYVPETAFVYSAASRLSIQLIDPDLAAGLTWDGSKWVGDGAGEVVVDVDTATSGDGIEGYKGEISVSGNFVYGYVWNTRTNSAGEGEYRLTFSLDGLSDGCVSLDGAQIMVPVEEEGEVSAEAEPMGNVPVVVGDKNLTYIDVGLTSRKGGGNNR